jgi:hypothetical protein
MLKLKVDDKMSKLSVSVALLKFVSKCSFVKVPLVPLNVIFNICEKHSLFNNDKKGIRIIFVQIIHSFVCKSKKQFEVT